MASSLASRPAPSPGILHGTVRVSVREEVAVVALSGEHDLATLEPLQAALDAAGGRGGAVTIDLSRCEFIDCSVARALLSGGHAATISIVVGSATPAVVLRLLDLLGVPFTVHSAPS